MKWIMRYRFQITCLVFLIMHFTGLNAQTSRYFNYQAVVSDPDGKPYEGTVGIKISIIQSSENGDVVYSERHTKETNNGFVSFRVGEGDQIYTGEFDTINWSIVPSFIKTEIAPGGGYSYSLSSTAELVNVPLAMYAIQADSIAADFIETDPLFAGSVASMITPEDTLRWNAISKKAEFQIGDLHEGGIIFYLEPDGEHGMIASLTDIAADVPWGPDLVTGANSNYDGAWNSAEIINANGTGNYAAYYCDTLVLNGYDDWYLPSPDEMYLLFRAGYMLNKILEEDENETTEGVTTGGYWSSRELSGSEAYLFENGQLGKAVKNLHANVRAIRQF